MNDATAPHPADDTDATMASVFSGSEVMWKRFMVQGSRFKVQGSVRVLPSFMSCLNL